MRRPSCRFNALFAWGFTLLLVLALASVAGATGFPAPVAQSGQTQCFDVFGANGINCAGTGQDGAIRAGVPFPGPRFTDNGKGTVTDNLTGLIWLRDANCFGFIFWADALTAANTLASGSCGLSDGSVAGDWRLPNVRELQSLVDVRFVSPALSNAAGTARWTQGDAFSDVAFSFVSTAAYWSSTSAPDLYYGGIFGGLAWEVNLGFTGETYEGYKPDGYRYVWPVRGPSVANSPP